MKFQGKTVMITGASVGIGRACAITFAQAGANLVLLDMDTEKLNALEKELSIGPRCRIYTCDVSDNAAVCATVSDATEAFGKIDILVNNAALWRLTKPFLELTPDQWQTMLNINVMGVVYCTQAVLPKMMENNFGRVINVASVAGVYGIAQMAPYCATKGALIAMTKALAKEMAEKNITVNSVAPGSVSDSKDMDIHSFSETHLSYKGRTGTGAENANLIAFLASEEAAYINGQNIQIDGCRKMV